MKNLLSIILDGEPGAKLRMRFDPRRKGGYTPEKTVRYEGRLAHAASIAMQGRPLLEGPLDVSIMIHVAIPKSKSRKWKADAAAGVIRPMKKPDVDNTIKLLDALNAVVFVDDCQVVDVHAHKYYSERPRLEVHIRSADAGIDGDDGDSLF